MYSRGDCVIKYVDYATVNILCWVGSIQQLLHKFNLSGISNIKEMFSEYPYNILIRQNSHEF